MKAEIIYLLMLVTEKTKDELNLSVLLESGSVKEAYFEKEDAEKRAEELNEMFGIEQSYNGELRYSKWYVIEKNIY